MPSLMITPPQQIYYDKDGSPLDSGFIYIGESEQNPETHPVAVFWDSSLTQPAPQPIRTLNGYPYRQGAISSIYTESGFSITIRNKNKELVYSTKNGKSEGSSFAIFVFEKYSDALSSAAALPDGQRISVLDVAATYVVSSGNLVEQYADDSIKVIGGKKDGSDDTAAILNAIARVTASKTKRIHIPAGVWNLPGISTGALIPAGTEVFGDGMGVTVLVDPVAGSGRKIFIPGGDNITFRDMTLVGGQGDTVGTYYADNVAISNNNDGNNYRNILVQRVETKGFGDGGVRIWRGHTCKVEACNLHDIGRFGVFMFGGEGNRIWFNKIKSIKPGNGGNAPFINAYGFSFSCDVGEAGFPKSKNCVAAFNIIDDVPTWEGMDIHGGDGIDILFNTVTNCMIGLFAGPASGANNVALDNCRVHGNRFTTSTTYRRGGIIAAPTYAVGTVFGKNISITENTVVGFGKNQATHNAGFASLEGAIHAVGIDGLDVTGNTITDFNCAGLYVRQNTRSGKILGNTVQNGEPTNGVSAAYLFETNTSIVSTFNDNLAVRTSGSEFTAFDILGGGGIGDFGIRFGSNNEFIGMSQKFGASALGRVSNKSTYLVTPKAQANVTNNGVAASIVGGAVGVNGATRVSIGRVSISLTEAMPNTNYKIGMNARGSGSFSITVDEATKTVNGFDVLTYASTSGALVDANFFVDAT